MVSFRIMRSEEFFEKGDRLLKMQEGASLFIQKPKGR
jgi:hypothetical protein